MNFKILLIIIFVVIITVCLFVFFPFLKNKMIHSIKKFEYDSSGGMRYDGNTYYKINCQNDNCTVDIKLPYQIEKKNIKISHEKINEIVDLFNQYHVSSWNGFDKIDKNVLDGSSFHFHILCDDDTSIDAHGYMKYPKNYKNVISSLKSILNPLYESAKNVSLFELDSFNGFQIDSVEKLEIEKRTVAGIDVEEITDSLNIKKVYEEWKSVVILDKCEQACDDNTVIYRFVMKNGEKYEIEKECDWLVINHTRYYYDIEK